MKKFKLIKNTCIVIVNVILLYFILHAFKFISLYMFLSPECKEFSQDCLKRVKETMAIESYESFYEHISYRPIENIFSNKPPIIFFGCSYTFGAASIPPMKTAKLFQQFLAEC